MARIGIDQNMICFLGQSHAARHLRNAAAKRGLQVALEPYATFSPDLIFVSEDTPTDIIGNRDLDPIRAYIKVALEMRESHGEDIPIVLTSQVPPGFTRSLGIANIYHQAETLRIKDAAERAYSPDYIAVGGPDPLPLAYRDYLLAFQCPVFLMSWEEAEFSKIAVNMMLAAQVDATNRLAAASAKVGANWGNVSKALANDKRIGPHAYLTPGRWQDSPHLMRDFHTLEEISTR